MSLYNITIVFFFGLKFKQICSIRDYSFYKKKPLKCNEKLSKKPCIQLVKKSFKLNKKTRRKTKSLINKKLLKLDKKTRKKTKYL